MTFILQNLPWFWFALMILFCVIEALTVGLTSIWMAISSFVLIFVSFTKIPILYQFLIFVVLSTVLFFTTRPFLKSKLKIGEEKTNADSLINKKALVVKKITPFEKGEIKIQGQIWTCQASDDTLTIEANTEVIIEEIRGVTAIVKTV